MIRLPDTFFVYRTPLGRITLASDGQAVTRLAFGVERLQGEYRSCDITNRASSEILEYLAKKRTEFSVALHLQGSAFQQEVWRFVQNIPYGQTLSYVQVADALGNAKGIQAVAHACVENPLPIFVPTHRVIGMHGDVGSFVSDPAIKQFLINLERDERKS